MSARKASWLVVMCAVFGCSKGRELRGVSTPSPDGLTYLAIDEADRQGCELFVDGVRWRHALRAAARVAAGKHMIECREPGDASLSAVIEIETRSGRTFHFDYWGP